MMVDRVGLGPPSASQDHHAFPHEPSRPPNPRHLMIQAILTDIEGTTSSIRFVKDVLFPYARERLPAFVETHTDDPDVQHWLHEAAKEAGYVSATQQEIIDLLVSWIGADRKSTALKALQGMIWKRATSTANTVRTSTPKCRRACANGIARASASMCTRPARSPRRSSSSRTRRPAI